jgi:hypothetical protein
MAQVITGARGKVVVNGQVVGFVGGVDVDIENTLADVDVLGQIERADLAEVGHKCNFTINYFKAVPPSTPTTKGAPHGAAAGVVFPLSAAGLGIDSSSANTAKEGVKAGDINLMRSQVYFDVEIQDDLQGGNNVFVMQNCKLEGGTGRLEARGIWQGTWKFQAQKGFGL